MIWVAETYCWLEFAGAAQVAGSTATGDVVVDPAHVTLTNGAAGTGSGTQVATWVGPALLGPAGLTQVTQAEPSQKGGSLTLQDATGVSLATVPQVVTT